MRVTFSGKSVQLTDREREYAEKKLSRLARYFNTAREAHVMHSVQRNQQIVEAQLDLDGVLLRAEERTPDIFASIDAVTDKLEQQGVEIAGTPTQPVSGEAFGKVLQEDIAKWARIVKQSGATVD